MGSFRGILAPAALVVFLTPAAPAQNTPSAAQLNALAGEYTSADTPGSPISVYLFGGKLVLETDRMVPTELEPVSATDFQFGRPRSTLHFSVDAGGEGTSLTLSDAPNSILRRVGPPVHHVFHDYKRTEVMIPMRDGIKLHAVVLTPADIGTPLPILMQRTPYGVDDTSRASFFRERPELARAGYIYVAEDIRGRFKSDGEFVMMRPLADHSNPKNIDESTDTWDTVDWLVKNLPRNNGRVGVLGVSYPGFLAMMAGIDPHPAVKAISPQAPMIDVWMGDDFFHNGAFRQTYGYDYVLSMESSKKVNDVMSYGKGSDGKPVDGYDFFLQRGSFEADVKQSGAKMLPTWKLFLDDPSYDRAWKSRAVEYHLKKVTVPTLTVGGYYDQEDMYGPQEEYSSLEPHDSKHENFLVLGPWRHGYWTSSSDKLGNLKYGEPIGNEFRAQIEAPFFAHFLKDEGALELENTASFQTGSDTWKRYAQFPPAQAQTTRLHLGSGGKLNWTGSVGEPVKYVSDPANPIPYRHRPIEPTYSNGSHWYNWMTEDQRFVTGRKDVAVWTLPVQQQDLTITGEVVADIFAATSGSDNDMVVKLIDQYPADDPDPTMRGYQLMTNMEIFRGRYLSGFDHPTALKPGTVAEYKFSLHDVDHVFKAGHTVMVEIQSTWFPLYDRNPQTFVPNIMKAKPTDYKQATISIYSGPGHDSSLQLPVISACGRPECP